MRSSLSLKWAADRVALQRSVVLGFAKGLCMDPPKRLANGTWAGFAKSMKADFSFGCLRPVLYVRQLNLVLDLY